jgi:hypothetical protein
VTHGTHDTAPNIWILYAPADCMDAVPTIEEAL